MISAILCMGGLGFTLSVMLYVASRIFHVPEDPRLAAVKAALPGLNCGACGFAGCAGAAAALIAGNTTATVCIAGDMAVVEALMRLTGEAGGLADRSTAVVCCGGPDRLPVRFSYQGPADCRAAVMLFGGWNGCESGCLGGGTCVRVCPFDAIRMDAQRQPHIDADRCRGCGRCAAACPRSVIRLETLSDRLLRLDRNSDCLAPCRQKCPAQVDAPHFIRRLRDGKNAQALQVLKWRNPFPAIVGRTCPHPCETICRRNIADEGVAIGHLERYLGDWERHAGRRLRLACLPDSGIRIAVVGAGPAGLACAYFLRRLGHHPIIFDARSAPGGMMRYGIPGYRLPREVVDWEVGGIMELGIGFRPNMQLGRDFTLSELRRTGFQAIFLGLGAWSVPALGVPGEAAPGVWRSLDFLAAVGDTIRQLSGRQVVVVGESNTAMDCARCSVRLGAAAVTVVCPGDREEMSARRRDVARAEAEGVVMRLLSRPVRIVADASGRACGVICQDLLPDPDRTDAGTTHRPVGGSEQTIEADLVIVAAHRRPDIDFLQEGEDAMLGLRITRSGTLAVTAITQLAAAPDIFAAGDMQTGRASVISAVGGGRQAARAIHHCLTTGTVCRPDDLRTRINPASILKGVSLPLATSRVALRELPLDQRRRSFIEEVVATIDACQAQSEARRCLACGTRCYFRPAGTPIGRRVFSTGAPMCTGS